MYIYIHIYMYIYIYRHIHIYIYIHMVLLLLYAPPANSGDPELAPPPMSMCSFVSVCILCGSLPLW